MSAASYDELFFHVTGIAHKKLSSSEFRVSSLRSFSSNPGHPLTHLKPGHRIAASKHWLLCLQRSYFRHLEDFGVGSIWQPPGISATIFTGLCFFRVAVCLIFKNCHILLRGLVFAGLFYRLSTIFCKLFTIIVNKWGNSLFFQVFFKFCTAG